MTTSVMRQPAVKAITNDATTVTRCWDSKPNWSPTAPRMLTVSIASREAIAPEEFSGLSNQPTSCSQCSLLLTLSVCLQVYVCVCVGMYVHVCGYAQRKLGV